jgi:hypothetical protein
MENNRTSELITEDAWNPVMNASAIVSELLGFVLLALGIVGMYEGIEVANFIDHFLWSNRFSQGVYFTNIFAFSVKASGFNFINILQAAFAPIVLYQ